MNTPWGKSEVVRTGMRTPWGTADSAKILAPGIGQVGTPSHGGIKLSRERNAKVHESCRAEGGWYEEDCEWAIPFFVFAADLLASNPDKYVTSGVAAAERSFKEWNPDAYTATTGKPVELSESHVLRERVFNETNKDKWHVISAWGDWQPGVPKDFVGVCARRGGRWNGYGKDTPERWFLVPQAEYDQRGEFSFIIDESKHIETKDFTKLTESPEPVSIMQAVNTRPRVDFAKARLFQRPACALKFC